MGKGCPLDEPVAGSNTKLVVVQFRSCILNFAAADVETARAKGDIRWPTDKVYPGL